MRKLDILCVTSKIFAIIRKQTSHTTYSINLHLFSVMLLSIHTTIHYHHKYKITDSVKPELFWRQENSFWSHTYNFTSAQIYQSKIHMLSVLFWNQLTKILNFHGQNVKCNKRKTTTNSPPEKQDCNPSYNCFTNDSITIGNSSFPTSLPPPK